MDAVVVEEEGGGGVKGYAQRCNERHVGEESSGSAIEVGLLAARENYASASCADDWETNYTWELSVLSASAHFFGITVE